MGFPSVPAAFIGPSFLGARVLGVNANIGWGVGNPNQLSVQLVDDPTYDLSYAPPSLGTPVTFAFGEMVFRGLLQRSEERKGTNGNPIYDVTLIDPREILDGAQVILGQYNGTTGGVPNLFNVYGFWENQAYGASLENESGMPWPLVSSAITSMANQAGSGPYGGPLVFRGIQYGLDFSELPTSPAQYRVGGSVSMSLLEIIAQICEDGGCDFFVELDGFTIVIRTVSRLLQPPLGTIAAIVNDTSSHTVVRSSDGLEIRNELTSSFLVGGDITTLWQTDAMTQFWGYDIDGFPIIGQQILLKILGIPDPPSIFNPNPQAPVLSIVPTETMNLNASPVADIVGSTSYACSTIEMRLAQANFESWAAFIVSQKPGIAQVVGVLAPFVNNGIINRAPIRPILVNDEKKAAVAIAKAAVLTDANARMLRLYEFVKGYADDYWGRQYLVGLPFILAKEDAETLKITTSWEVTDSGYLEDGSAPLGLNELNQDIFSNDDGRFRAFVTISGLAGVDLSKISTSSSIIQDNKLFISVSVDQRIVEAPTPCALITLNGPIVEQAVDNVGDVGLTLNLALQASVNADNIKHLNSPVPFKIAPAVRNPTAAAVPLKSNTLTYGPWLAAGVAGKVRVEHDPSLTPWNYGGYDVMNEAATARVATSITNMQVSESGSLELAGLPLCSLGDTLQSGGPNVTSIDIQISPNGATTSYRFQTYTQRYGILGKGYIERLKRISLAAVDQRRALRAQVNDNIINNQARADAGRTAKAFMERQAKAFKRETPHDVFHSYSSIDKTDGTTRTHVSLSTEEEVITMSHADNDADFVKTSMMGISGLIRPFATNQMDPGSGVMPTYYEPVVTGVANKTTLDPWGGQNDTEVWSWGSSYQGLHAYRRGGDGANARVMGLRAPAVLVGYGYDVTGKCVPSDDGGMTFASGCRVHQERHVAGPLDTLWDGRRGVWTVHDVTKGYLIADAAAGGSGLMEVRDGGPVWNTPVWNYFGTAVPSGRKVFATYIASDNKLYISAADCSTS